MSTIRVSTALAVIAALALSALPVQAQDDRGSAGDRPRAERRRPRSDGDGQRNEGRRAQADRGRRNESRREAPRRLGMSCCGAVSAARARPPPQQSTGG